MTKSQAQAIIRAINELRDAQKRGLGVSAHEIVRHHETGLSWLLAVCGHLDLLDSRAQRLVRKKLAKTERPEATA